MPGERILIVDDELPIRMALKTAFLREGMVPQEASCGSQALEMIRSQTFDLVVLDIMMQDMAATPFSRTCVQTGTPPRCFCSAAVRTRWTRCWDLAWEQMIT